MSERSEAREHGVLRRGHRDLLVRLSKMPPGVVQVLRGEEAQRAKKLWKVGLLEREGGDEDSPGFRPGYFLSEKGREWVEKEKANG